MKYGIREICDVVLKAKSKMKVGNRIFYKDEPVIYFDSLKTSTMEGAATTVYATGGRGNSRLIAWEGERTVTWTMEDALISHVGLAILTGADVIETSNTKGIKVHATENGKVETAGEILISKNPEAKAGSDMIYVMKLDGQGNVASEPYIASGATAQGDKYKLTFKRGNEAADFKVDDLFLVDYYYEAKGEGVATQIDITPDKFGGNFYLEASTLFRDTNGVDMPAEFIIPNCKVQSNFTFTMASSGDPSTFTFTMDAFPDYTRFGDKKVLSAIQIISEESADNYHRVATDASDSDAVGGDKIENAGADPLVVAAVNAIDAIDETKSETVTAARDAVDALTDKAQVRQVYNMEKLIAAEMA